MRSALSLLSLAGIGLGASGCATAGLALVGPLAGSLTAIADRSVDRTMPADLGTTWGATADALARMAIRVDQTEKSEAKWRLTGTGEAATVHSTLERVTAGMTKVSVRVEVGGLFADKQTSEELLNQIAASLGRAASVSARPTPGSDAASQELRRLHREIERLGTKIEETRAAPPTPPQPEVGRAMTVTSNPIVVVPTSAGVPSVPATHVSIPKPAPASAPAHAGGWREARPVASRPAAEVQEGRLDSVVVGPMESVEILRPVEALQIRPVRE